MTKFTADLRAFAKATGRTLDQIARGVPLELAERVVRRMPVDTSNARSQVQIGDGRPDTRIDSPLDNRRRGAAPGAEQWARWLDQLEGTRAGGVVYVTDSVPYIRRLEFDGHSKQAPGGMFRVTIEEFEQVVKKVIEEKK